MSQSTATNNGNEKVQELLRELGVKQKQLESTVGELQNVEHNNFMLTDML